MSIQKVLSPLLMISYVCGLRVIEFPTRVLRQWLGLLYILLLWSLYNFVFIYKVIPHTIHDYPILHHIWLGVNIFIALLSIIIGIYHDKEFRNCIKNLTTVNNTLEKLEIAITDQKLYMRTILLILGWFIVVILIICMEIIRCLASETRDIALVICSFYIHVYCIAINTIGDLILTSMLGYIGLKFDQINEHLEKLTKDRIKQSWKHPVLHVHQSRYAKAPRNAYIIWIVIHLHLELRKISRKINLIFGTQMTIEMGCYFASIALGIQEVFNMLLITNNFKYKQIFQIITLLLGLFQNICRLFLINYECERVSMKANATGNFISKLSYSNCDVEIRENILQFLLMTRSSIRFCGIGLFQFGFKFLRSFTTSVVTVLVILLQSYTNK